MELYQEEAERARRLEQLHRDERGVTILSTLYALGTLVVIAVAIIF